MIKVANGTASDCPNLLNKIKSGIKIGPPPIPPALQRPIPTAVRKVPKN